CASWRDTAAGASRASASMRVERWAAPEPARAPGPTKGPLVAPGGRPMYSSGGGAPSSALNRGSFNIDIRQLQVAVEHDDVVPGAGGKPPAVGGAEVIGRVGGDAARRVWKVESELVDQVAQGLVHRERGAGQGTVGQAHAAEAFGDLVAAELVLPVGHAGSGRRVGDAIQARDG